MSIFRLSGLASTLVLCMSTTMAATQPANALTDEELSKRMDAEKAARRDCKLEICKAFAEPQPDGGPITCDVTKTWLKKEITGRVTGGDWVWRYGNMQCSMTLNLDRGVIAKAASGETVTASFPEHTLNCNVDDADAAKGQAFSVKVSLTPVAKFEKGEAKSVSLEPVKTEGSAVASAAVTAMMAADQVSGVVSSAAAAEINDFVYAKCKADGVEVKKP